MEGAPQGVWLRRIGEHTPDLEQVDLGEWWLPPWLWDLAGAPSYLSLSFLFCNLGLLMNPLYLFLGPRGGRTPRLPVEVPRIGEVPESHCVVICTCNFDNKRANLSIA